MNKRNTQRPRRTFLKSAAASLAGVSLVPRSALGGPDFVAPNDRYRVGILGMGHWYSAFGLARGLAEYPKADLVAVADRDQDHVDEFAGTFEIDGYTSYRGLLDEADVDIVLIAAPVSHIPECTIMAANAGKHIILGKPMAMNIEQADRMVSAVEAAAVKCVPYQVVARLGGMGLKRRIDNGEIGDVAVLHQTSRWSIAEDWFRSGKPGWFVDPEHVPGGALIDEGIYAIEMFGWLAGSDIVRAEARTANIVHKDIEVEDWGMATFTLENGVIATLEAAWTINSPQKTGPSPKQNAVVRTEIIGTRGEIMTQRGMDPSLAILAAGAPNWVYVHQAGEPFTPPSPGPLVHLIECIEEDREPLATIQDARKSFAAAMAAYASAEEGRPVDVASIAQN